MNLKESNAGINNLCCIAFESLILLLIFHYSLLSKDIGVEFLLHLIDNF